MEIFTNCTFRFRTLSADDTDFVDCVLEDCVLEYSGKSIIFERTHLRRCRYVFFGPAKATVRFLQETELLPCDPMTWAECSDLVH